MQLKINKAILYESDVYDYDSLGYYTPSHNEGLIDLIGDDFHVIGYVEKVNRYDVNREDEVVIKPLHLYKSERGKIKLLVWITLYTGSAVEKWEIFKVNDIKQTTIPALNTGNKVYLSYENINLYGVIHDTDTGHKTQRVLFEVIFVF